MTHYANEKAQEDEATRNVICGGTVHTSITTGKALKKKKKAYGRKSLMNQSLSLSRVKPPLLQESKRR